MVKQWAVVVIIAHSVTSSKDNLMCFVREWLKRDTAMRDGEQVGADDRKCSKLSHGFESGQTH